MTAAKVTAGIFLFAGAAFLIGWQSPSGAKKAEAASTNGTAELTQQISSLEKQLQEKASEVQRLKDEITQGTKAKDTPAPTRPVVVEPGVISVPVFFPESRRPLATATLFWRKGTNQTGQDVFFPMVILPPHLRASFTQRLTNTVERAFTRDVNHNYNFYPYYYPTLFPVEVAAGTSPTPIIPNSTPPPDNRFPPPLPRFGNEQGQPPALPRFGIKRP